MRDQADAFRSECEGLRALLTGAGELDYTRRTQFKGWSFDDVLRHLHFWNIAADTSLDDEAGFAALRDELMTRAGDGDMRQAETQMVGGLAGAELLAAWAERAGRMADRFAEADPKRRLLWVGPSMSARSSITARLMETWAHGQELYDELGEERVNSDAVLRNVTVLGVNTFGWTFANRKLEVPAAMPRLLLTAPSGERWEWEGPDGECIEGSAEAFCQVVTQVRNVADTDLRTTGQVATAWMRQAQCFAGPPNDPPPPGTRFRRTT